MSGAGKSLTANTLLTRNHFATRKSDEPTTKTISHGETKTNNKKIIVFDTPGLISAAPTSRPGLLSAAPTSRPASDVIPLLFSPSGPHVVVYVIKFGSNWIQEAKCMKHFLDIFEETVFPFLLVVFVNDETEDRKFYSKYIKSSPEYCEDFCQRAGVGYTWINSAGATTENEDRIWELIDYSIELKMNICYSKCLNEVRFVLIGKTGSGKSATGNTLLQRECFDSKSSGTSLTQRSGWHETIFGHYKIRIIDTPGFFDNRIFANDIEGHKWLRKEVLKSILFCVPGPHAFLFVIQIGRWLESDTQAAERVIRWFGDDLYKHIIVFFSFFDLNDYETLDDYIASMPQNFRSFFEKCGKRKIAVDNKMPDIKLKRQFTRDLLDILSEMPQQCYTNKYIEEATEVFFDRVNKEQIATNVSYKSAVLKVLAEIKREEDNYFWFLAGSFLTTVGTFIVAVCTSLTFAVPAGLLGIAAYSTTADAERKIKRWCTIL